MALDLSFHSLMKHFNVERREDGRLYFPDGSECNVQRALSNPVSCEVDRYSSKQNSPDISDDLIKKVRWC